MRHNSYPSSLEHRLVSFWQLRLILPSAWFSDARPSYLGLDFPQNQVSEFLFVPIVRLTDVLGRFTLPAYLLREAAIKSKMLRELGSKIHIVDSDCGFGVGHFPRTCLPMTSPY